MIQSRHLFGLLLRRHICLNSFWVGGLRSPALFLHLLGTQECVANYLDGGYMQCLWLLVPHFYYVSAGFASCPRATNVAVISLDARKAFDVVPKNCLIDNLREEGLPPPLLRLLHSYLFDRKQTSHWRGTVKFQASSLRSSARKPTGAEIAHQICQPNFTVATKWIFSLNCICGWPTSD